jgi:triacylglycerol lipase
MSLRKTVPPSTLDWLVVANKTYSYFEHWTANPFRGDAAGFDTVNAWWLAEASMLAYADTTFIAETLERAGLRAAGFGVRFFARGGTQCFVLDGDAFILVVFRGTQVDDFWASAVDVATDAQFILVNDGAGGRVHKGFLQALANVWTELSAHLRRVLEADGAKTLWFAGHSLGGALATLSAERAARELGASVGGLYTFGSPRVGDKGFKARLAAHGIEDRTFRVVNDADIIARVPPAVLYRHVGRLRFIDGDGSLHQLDGDSGPPLRKRLPRRIREVFAAAPFFATSLRRFKLPVPKPLADHAPIYYAVHLWNGLQPEDSTRALTEYV